MTPDPPGTQTEIMFILGFNKDTFCMHKGRACVKPMILSTTTGHILEIEGPFLANSANSDAFIMASIIGWPVNSNEIVK